MTKRHVGNLYLPDATLGARGQQPTQDPATDTLVAADIPFERRPLRGRELEMARQIYAPASEEIKMYVGQSWKLSSNMYLQDKATGEVLNIGYVQYPEGIRTEATCVVGLEA